MSALLCQPWRVLLPRAALSALRWSCDVLLLLDLRCFVGMLVLGDGMVCRGVVRCGRSNDNGSLEPEMATAPTMPIALLLLLAIIAGATTWVHTALTIFTYCAVLAGRHCVKLFCPMH